MSDREFVSFVLGSDARREMVERLADGTAGGRDLVAEGTASESAIYDAISRLEEVGLATEVDDGWTLTGAGRLVADAIGCCERMETVLATDETYWRVHDPGGLPPRFRADIARLAGCSIVRAPDTDPFRFSRRVTDWMTAARKELAVVAPIYDDRRAEALLASEAEDRRLLVTPAVTEQLLGDGSATLDPDSDGVAIRVAEAAVSMVVTETQLVVSFPRLDGGYDTTTGILVDTDRGLDWGWRLFEYHWRGAQSIEEYLATERSERRDPK